MVWKVEGRAAARASRSAGGMHPRRRLVALGHVPSLSRSSAVCRQAWSSTKHSVLGSEKEQHGKDGSAECGLICDSSVSKPRLVPIIRPEFGYRMSSLGPLQATAKGSRAPRVSIGRGNSHLSVPTTRGVPKEANLARSSLGVHWKTESVSARMSRSLAA
jgi:hypothetical protein